MKKLLTISLYVLAGATFGIFLLGFSLHVRAGAPAQGATRNGDVNGDGVIDVSDAVYIRVLSASVNESREPARYSPF